MTQTTFGLRLNDAQIYGADNHATGKKDRVGIRLKRDGEAALAPAGGSGWDALPDDGFGDPFGGAA